MRLIDRRAISVAFTAFKRVAGRLAIIISNDDVAISTYAGLQLAREKERREREREREGAEIHGKPGRLIRRNDGLKGTIHRHDWMPTAFRNTCKPIGRWHPAVATSRGIGCVTTDGLRRQLCRRL